jgi:hypothetical protein
MAYGIALAVKRREPRTNSAQPGNLTCAELPAHSKEARSSVGRPVFMRSSAGVGGRQSNRSPTVLSETLPSPNDKTAYSYARRCFTEPGPAC